MPSPIAMHLLLPATVPGAHVLLLGGGLPCVEPPIDEEETLVLALRRHLMTEWDLEATVLETYLPPVTDGAPMTALATLAPAPDGWRPPPGTAWGPAPDDLPAPVAERARTWCAELNGRASAPEARARWSTPGWHERAVGWIDAALADAGRRRAGRVEVIRIWTISALMRVPLIDGHAWFKAVFPQFHHEPAVTRLLRELAGDRIPRVIATEPNEGWLLLDDVAGGQLGMRSDPDAITGGVRALVDVQRRAMPHHAELRSLGAPHRPLAELAEGLAKAIDLAAEIGEPVGDRSHARAAVRWVERRAGWLDTHGLPETVVHGDFNRANVLMHPDGPVIIDWSDTAISHPLLDVVVWLVHPDGRFGPQDPSWPAWLDALATLGDTEPLRNELPAVFGLGAAYQVVSYADILVGIEPAMRYQVADGLHGFWKLLAESVDA